MGVCVHAKKALYVPPSYSPRPNKKPLFMEYSTKTRVEALINNRSTQEVESGG